MKKNKTLTRLDLLNDMKEIVMEIVKFHKLDLVNDLLQLTDSSIETTFIWFVRTMGTHLFDINSNFNQEEYRRTFTDIKKTYLIQKNGKEDFKLFEMKYKENEENENS